MKKQDLDKAIVKKDNGNEINNAHPIFELIAKAVETSVPVETLERLFALSREVKADQAREAFIQALANFQERIPVIKKTKIVKNRDGTTRYAYAPLESVIEQIKKLLSENKLAYNWDSARDENHIRVICKLTHELGHSEQSSFDIPIEKSEYMSSPQTYATAQSYAKRYTLLNVLGIGTADEDNDAQDTDKIQTAKDPRARIMLLLKQYGEDITDRTKEELAEMVKKATNLNLIPSNFNGIIDRLEVLISEQQGL